MPATSPSCLFNSDTLYPDFSPHMIYILSSIADQSQLSVPPAPALISRMQLSSSSGLLSVDRNSTSSITSRASRYASSTSSSVAISSLENSNNTSKSSTAVCTFSKDATQSLCILISLRMDSASSGFSQKVGLSDLSVLSSIWINRFSTSKIAS